MISSKGSVVVGEQGAGGAWLLGGLVVPDRGGEGEGSLQDAAATPAGAIMSKQTSRSSAFAPARAKVMGGPTGLL